MLTAQLVPLVASLPLVTHSLHGKFSRLAGADVAPQTPSIHHNGRSRRARSCRCMGVEDEGKVGTSGEEKGRSAQPGPPVDAEQLKEQLGVTKRRTADSTDPISSALTRRFGLAGGLVWLGILSFGVISEQLKTRREVYEAEQNTREVKGAKEVTLADGVKYTDLKVGGGAAPQKGDLVLVQFTGSYTSQGEGPTTFIDTSARGGRGVAFLWDGGAGGGAVTKGLEEAIGSMRQGGKRRVVVPSELGYGDQGAELPSGARVPGGVELEYVVELLRVSIPPS